MNLFNYQRRKSSEAHVGNIIIGGESPIRIQSMTNTSTMDTEPTVAQAIRIIEKGADLVRFTAQGTREAENLAVIRERIFEHGYATPLVADIHFNAKVALAAAKSVEKVRINPGNYVDTARKFKEVDYTDEEYAQELEKIEEKLVELLDTCRQNNTAIRIGVNHGSLSDRIMCRYGNSAEGMVESCMEFLRICVKHQFKDIVISMKASNTVVMVRSVRWLIECMERENMHFPIHLGVTEAGDGEDGRIKSALGIGALLADGYGDTIRVSLSEAPENEVPVGKKLADYIVMRRNHESIAGTVAPQFNYFAPEKRKTTAVAGIGGTNLPVVLTTQIGKSNPTPDWSVDNDKIVNKAGDTLQMITPQELLSAPQPRPSLLPLTFDELDENCIAALQLNPSVVILLLTNHVNGVGEQRAFFHQLLRHGIENPVIISRYYEENEVEDLMLKAAADFGPLLLDGFGDGILVTNHGAVSAEAINSLMFGILQAARLRMSKTEFISCPGCGRTMFNLEPTIAKVKSATSHLKNLKIGIMGCIVNGPGEMADADYGYVGAGRGRISLYKNKECIEKNIPEDEAVGKLIELIKANGDWKDN